MGHATSVVNVGRRTARIDLLLVPLIEALWRAGIGTFSSCQGDSGARSWLVLSTGADGDRLCRAIARPAEYDVRGSLSRRALLTGAGVLAGDFSSEKGSDGQWWWNYHGTTLGTLGSLESSEPHISVWVCFPSEDIDEIVARVDEWRRPGSEELKPVTPTRIRAKGRREQPP